MIFPLLNVKRLCVVVNSLISAFIRHLKGKGKGVLGARETRGGSRGGGGGGGRKRLPGDHCFSRF